MAEEQLVGNVFTYYSKIGVAAIDLTDGSLKVGDTIRVKGATTDFTQEVDSMQIEHQNVEEAQRGAHIGVKVKDRVRPHDKVYKVA